MIELVPERDPILRTPCQPWDFSNPPQDAHELSRQMHHTMHAQEGIGLAAPQVGLAYQVFTMYDPMTGRNFTCFNPEIQMLSEKTVSMEEGCLSFPDLKIPVVRPESIDVRYQNVLGEYQEEHLTGLIARCYQHENDHLSGVCFTDRVSRLVLERAQKKRVKLLKGKR